MRPAVAPFVAIAAPRAGSASSSPALTTTQPKIPMMTFANNSSSFAAKSGLKALYAATPSKYVHFQTSIRGFAVAVCLVVPASYFLTLSDMLTRT